MRLVTVPQRRPCILAGVVAPQHCGSVRTEHNGEDVRARNNLGDVCRTIKNVRTVEHPQRLMAGHGHRQIVACEHLSGLAPRSLVPPRLLLKGTPAGMCTSCRGSLRDRPAASPNGDGAAGVRMGSMSGNRSTLRRTSGRLGRRATRRTPGARICQSCAWPTRRDVRRPTPAAVITAPLPPSHQAQRDRGRKHRLWDSPLLAALRPCRIRVLCCGDRAV